MPNFVGDIVSQLLLQVSSRRRPRKKRPIGPSQPLNANNDSRFLESQPRRRLTANSYSQINRRREAHKMNIARVLTEVAAYQIRIRSHRPRIVARDRIIKRPSKQLVMALR